MILTSLWPIRCRIFAVVGPHGNTFKPHTGTKTSVLFLQKWDEKLCPKKEDYNIFFDTQQKPAKDNRGKKIYIQQGYVAVTDIRELKEKGIIKKRIPKENLQINLVL